MAVNQDTIVVVHKDECVGINDMFSIPAGIAHCGASFHFQNAHTLLSMAFFAKMDSKMKILQKPAVVFAGVGKNFVSIKFDTF